jgi:RimJ/RimL family protein N-acetyltransferase
MEREDMPFVHRLNADPVVRARVVGWGWPTSLSEQTSWFEAQGRGDHTHRWVVERLDGAPIGVTGLWDVDWHNRNALSALKLGGGPEVRGAGFGTDAIKAVMAYAFHEVGLERLYSTILADNAASIRAYCDKSGWQVEGRARRHIWRHGRWVDLLHVAALKSDFAALPDVDVYRRLIIDPHSVHHAEPVEHGGLGPQAGPSRIDSVK